MSEYNNPSIEKYGYDPAAAQAAIEAAGWAKNADGIYEKDGETLSFTINCGQGDQVRIDMANICAQNLNEIGCDVTVEVPAEVDWAGQDAYLIGWGSPFDPDDHMYKVFGTGKGANYSSYSNEELDTLMQQARQLENGDARTQLYLDAQEVMADDPAYSYIAYIDAIYAGASNISGMSEDKVLGHHGVGIFWNIYEWEIN
jgi:peptide/nickel transport system substrate-binding protein